MVGLCVVERVGRDIGALVDVFVGIDASFNFVIQSGRRFGGSSI